MHRRTEGNAYSIRHDVLPTEVLAFRPLVMHLLGYGGYDTQDRTNDGEGKASTEVLHLVLACPRVITFAHCLLFLSLNYMFRVS